MSKNSLSAENMRKALMILYDRFPDDYGSTALGTLLYNIDISQIKRKELELIYTFIDEPLMFFDDNISRAGISVYFDRQMDFNFGNLIYLTDNLPSFEKLDPKEAKANEIPARVFAEQVLDNNLDLKIKKWNVADSEDQKKLLKEAYALLGENMKVKPPLRFIPSPSFGSYNFKTGLLNITCDKWLRKEESYMQAISSLLHECTHAEQDKRARNNYFFRLVCAYYLPIKIVSVKTYKGNYIEKQAFHRENKFFDFLNEDKPASLPQQIKAKQLSDRAYTR